MSAPLLPVPPLPCFLPPPQVGQLDIPTLPLNYRDAANQLGFVMLDWK